MLRTLQTERMAEQKRLRSKREDLMATSEEVRAQLEAEVEAAERSVQEGREAFKRSK